MLFLTLNVRSPQQLAIMHKLLARKRALWDADADFSSCSVLVSRGVSSQAGSDPNAFVCAKRMWSTLGIRGFYRGAALHSTKAIPAVAVTYIAYEKSKQLLRISY